MDFYDKGIMTILRDGKLRSFQQILFEVGSPTTPCGSTLTNWWTRASSRGSRCPGRGTGRPLFDYRLSRGVEKAVSALLNPSLGLVAVSFDGLHRVCRREKGGFCKEIRG